MIVHVLTWLTQYMCHMWILHIFVSAYLFSERVYRSPCSQPWVSPASDPEFCLIFLYIPGPKWDLSGGPELQLSYKISWALFLLILRLWQGLGLADVEVLGMADAPGCRDVPAACSGVVEVAQLTAWAIGNSGLPNHKATLQSSHRSPQEGCRAGDSPAASACKAIPLLRASPARGPGALLPSLLPLCCIFEKHLAWTWILQMFYIFTKRQG